MQQCCICLEVEAGVVGLVEPPGSARLVLVDGVAHLDPARAVFDGMLDGWEAQQRARLLSEHTIGARLAVVRRFAAFTNEYPWAWRPADVEDFASMLRSGDRPRAHSTIRNYQIAIGLFCGFITDARYGWAAACEHCLRHSYVLAPAGGHGRPRAVRHHGSVAADGRARDRAVPRAGRRVPPGAKARRHGFGRCRRPASNSRTSDGSQRRYRVTLAEPNEERDASGAPRTVEEPLDPPLTAVAAELVSLLPGLSDHDARAAVIAATGHGGDWSQAQRRR